MTNTSYSMERELLKLMYIVQYGFGEGDTMRRFTKYIIQDENVHASFHDKTFEDAFHLFSP